MKVLNLFSGPGTGKSTTAAGLFYHMKCMGIETEYVQEYAKDLVYEHRHHTLSDQIYIFAKQQRRIARLQDHGIEWVITDSPIPLGLIYLQPGVLSEQFNSLVWEVFHKYDNYNFVLTRNVKYSPRGRNQKHEHEAIEFDQAVHKLLHDNEISFQYVQGGETAVDSIMQLVNEHHTTTTTNRMPHD
jgi:hypothetical protein